MSARFQTGIDTLLSRHRDWLQGRRVGLLSHTAAVDVRGCSSAEKLWRDQEIDLTCLLAPEHGFYGRAGAGETCRSVKHPAWGIPIMSLYGKQRAPTPSMFQRVDVIVFDLQDIGCRAYTYVSTLRLLLEAAAVAGKTVIVADRPAPLPNTTDGPVTDDRFRSFVSQIDAPLSYGMTPGEVALWLQQSQSLALDVRVSRMNGYARTPFRPLGSPPWLPPSPAMRSWESAMCFPATVCMEGLGALDHGRRTNLPFQVFGASWTRGEPLAEALNARGLAGVQFYAHSYAAEPLNSGGSTIDGVRMVVTNPDQFRPALTAVTIVQRLQSLYGRHRVWARGKSRPEFFDKLWGTDSVRTMLLCGADASDIAATWTGPLRKFRRQRASALLYSKNGGAP